MLHSNELAEFNARCRAADSVHNGDLPEPLTHLLERRFQRPIATTRQLLPMAFKGASVALSAGVTVALVAYLGLAAFMGSAPGEEFHADSATDGSVLIGSADDET